MENHQRTVSLSCDLISFAEKALNKLALDIENNHIQFEEPHPFFDPDTLIAAAPLMKTGRERWLLVVRNGEQLIGVLPLEKTRLFGRFPMLHYQTLKYPHCFLATPQVRQGCTEQFVEALVNWLDHNATRGTFLSLTVQSGDGAFCVALKQDAMQHGRFMHEVESYERAIINFNSEEIDFEQYLADVIGHSALKKARVKTRKLQSQGPLSYERYQQGDDLDAWIEDFFRLEHASWKGQAGTSMRSNMHEEVFCKTILHKAADQGELVFTRMVLSGEVIACCIDIRRGNTLYAFKTAYDPAWRKYSPGVLLEHENLRLTFADPTLEELDSCATADHPVLDRLFKGRKKIVHYVVAQKSWLSHIPLRFALRVSTLRAKLCFKQNVNPDG